jgi:hypothetical protein
MGKRANILKYCVVVVVDDDLLVVSLKYIIGSGDATTIISRLTNRVCLMVVPTR